MVLVARVSAQAGFATVFSGQGRRPGRLCHGVSSQGRCPGQQLGLGIELRLALNLIAAELK